MKKIYLITFFALIVFASSANGTVKWNLQITDPQFNLNNYVLSKGVFKPFMPKTSWRCWFGKTESKGQNFFKKIRCNYSKAKSGEFTTIVSCSKSRPYGETKFDINDEKKKLLYQVLAFCSFSKK